MRRCTIITLSIYGGGKGQIKAFKYYIRGAIIKKMEKFGKNSLIGGGPLPEGVRFFSKKSQYQFGNFENPGGGLNFSKMSQFQLFCNYFAILPL